MNLKDNIFVIYCPSCDDIYSIMGSLEDAESMRWKHYWKSKEGHVKEENIIISEYKRMESKID